MIKRRFYRLEHGEKDGASDDSSSSSSSDNDSDVEPQLSDHNDDVIDDAKDDVSDDDDDDEQSSLSIQRPSVSSSGYESEGSSGDELVADRSGLIGKDDDSESESDKDRLNDIPIPIKENSETVKTRPEVVQAVDNVVLKSKSVFKCRLCPKIVCLNEESLATHLKSKRHARSEKLLNIGKLKRFLNRDGEEEEVSDDEDGETHAERHERILALAQAELSTKKSRGRQRQRERLKKKKQTSSEKPSVGHQKDNRAKRRKKNKD